MPLCRQIKNTPITVTQTADFTVTSVVPAVPDTTDGLVDTLDQIVLNSGAVVYYQTTAPTDPSLKEGDIWFDTDDGNKQYYYNGTAWVSVQDAAIAAAQSAANAAQTTADGKNRVYRQTTQPTTGPFAEGDLWFDTDDDKKIYRYTSGSWGTAVALGNNALANLSANKITSGSIDASVITVSNLNAGNISTGTLAADRIAAASITGSKIAAGTITASNIATNTITATQIAAGTITATEISTGYVYAGTINANQINAGTLTGFTVQTSSGSNAVILNGSANALQIKANTSVVSNMLNFSTSGTIWHHGSSPDSSGATYPQARLTSTSMTIYGGSSAYFAANAAGNTVVGATSYSGGTHTFSDTFVANSSATFNSTMFAPNLTTSTSATNLRVTTGSVGEIQETSASSIRFKENVVDVNTVEEVDPKKLLNLPVRAFTYKDDYLSVSDDRFGAILPGFIAEEVDAIYPVAADYGDGQPHSWNERFIIPGLLALVQDLYKEIALLKGE